MDFIVEHFSKGVREVLIIVIVIMEEQRPISDEQVEVLFVENSIHKGEGNSFEGNSFILGGGEGGLLSLHHVVVQHQNHRQHNVVMNLILLLCTFSSRCDLATDPQNEVREEKEVSSGYSFFMKTGSGSGEGRAGDSMGLSCHFNTRTPPS
jgi:hypothetical protein